MLAILILQLWLITATMNAFLGCDEDASIPAALASIVHFAESRRLSQSSAS